MTVINAAVPSTVSSFTPASPVLDQSLARNQIVPITRIANNTEEVVPPPMQRPVQSSNRTALKEEERQLSTDQQARFDNFVREGLLPETTTLAQGEFRAKDYVLHKLRDSSSTNLADHKCMVSAAEVSALLDKIEQMKTQNISEIERRVAYALSIGGIAQVLKGGMELPLPPSPPPQVNSVDQRATSGSNPGVQFVATSELGTQVQNLLASSKEFSTLLTSYGVDPSQYSSEAEEKLEGGSSDRFGGRAVPVEEQASSLRLVTLATDHTGEWGAAYNRRDKRGLFLVHFPGIWSKVPGLGQALRGILPEDTILGVVSDTGGAFEGRGSEKVDVAFNNIEIARSFSGQGTVRILGTVDAATAQMTIPEVLKRLSQGRLPITET